MYFLIMLLVFILLVITVKTIGLKSQKQNKTLWIQVVFFYLLSLLSLKFGSLHIPIGIIICSCIAFMLFRKNSLIIKTTLIFALIGYIFACYVVPPIKIKNLMYSKNIYEHLNDFKEVETVKILSKKEPLQKKLQSYTDQRVNKDHTMFLAYILNDSGVKIKNKNWLIYMSAHDLGIDARNKSEGKNQVLTYSYNGVDYMGYFQHDNKSNFPYLKYVIKGEIRK